MEQKIYEAAINAGVGGLIAALIIFLTYKLVTKLLTDVGLKMTTAFTAQAEALTRQAVSMEGLTTSIQNFVNRDNGEHREMLVLLKYIAQRSQAFDEVEREHNKRVKNGVHCKERDEKSQ
jgi:hypothetical protein